MNEIQTEYTELLALQEPLANPLAYTAHYIGQVNIKVNSIGLLYDEYNTPANVLADRCYLRYLADHNRYTRMQGPFKLAKVSRFSSSDIRTSLESHIYDMQKTAFKAKLAELACNGENLGPLTEWCRAINPDCTDLDIAKIAHFLWQVKRKMFGLKVVYHLFTLVHGPQNVGKSTAIEKLIAPFSPNSMCLKLDQLVDDKIAPSLVHSYAVFMDELDWKSKEDTSRLKNILTATTISYRPMRTNTIIQLPNNSTIIGAANKSIDEIIYDPSGMRRYAQFKSADKINHEAINSIDYLALVRGINEAREKGYTVEFREQLQLEQSVMVTQDDLDFFLEEYHLVPGVPDGSTNTLTIPIRQIYTQYVDYCQINNFKVLDIKWFSKKFKHKGFKTERVWNKEKNITVTYVTDECTIQEKKLGGVYSLNKEIV